jgi:hypothetical protein
MDTGRQTKKFPFGDSPFQNRVCPYLGINMYVLKGEKYRVSSYYQGYDVTTT